jgi:hypothetical protein
MALPLFSQFEWMKNRSFRDPAFPAGDTTRRPY